MLVNLQRAIEVRALLHRAFAVVLDHTAPENGLAFVVSGFQFQPGVIGVHGTAGKEVADFLSAHHNIHALSVSATYDRLHAIQRSGNGRRFGRCRGDLRFRFFSDGKRCRNV